MGLIRNGKEKILYFSERLKFYTAALLNKCGKRFLAFNEKFDLFKSLTTHLKFKKSTIRRYTGYL